MSQHSPSQLAAESHWFGATLLLIIAWCTYLHVPLVSGGRLLVPSFPTVVLIPVLILAVWRELLLTDVVFLAKVAFVLLLSIALSPGYEFVVEKFLGMAQFLMAIGVAVLIVRLMRKMKQRSVERALFVLWSLVVVGSVLEVFDVIRAPSDAFRAWAYTGTYTLYGADLRDMSLVGWPRPKLFSSEPSHVTKFFIASVNSWLLVRVTGRKAAVVAGATVLMLVVMGSPMLLISAIMTLVIVMWDRRTRLTGKMFVIVVVLLMGAIAGAYFAQSTYSNVVTRVENIDRSSESGQDQPSGDERRIVLPYVVLKDTWLSSPLFGVGVGGKEVVGQRSNTAEDSATRLKGNNALADIGIFLGIVGGVLFVYLFFRQARFTGVHRVGLMVVIVFLFSHLMGGIDTFRYWGFIALFWGSLAVVDGEELAA